MPCIDDRIYQFPNGAGPATYTLTVSGPAGAFTASAEFTSPDKPVQYWDPSEIVAPAIKAEPVAADSTCAVFITIYCVATRTEKIKVEATLDGTSYCRHISCVAGQTEPAVIHFVRRT